MHRATEQQVLGGRYTLIDLRGAGGMSEVWRGHDDVLGRDVAVKLLLPGVLTDLPSRERMRAEAKAVAQLSHPNITGVYDYGESDGTPYVVMELLDGQTLADRLGSNGQLAWRDAAAVNAEVATALAAAHLRGVVHRDVKPANVMLTAGGVKVFDFGIFGIAGSPDLVEEDGEIVGTPAYLAPERLVGGVVTPATDVYAVGLLLYRCLTGGLPWDADTVTQMISNHVYEAPRALPAIDGLPAEVQRIYERCLAKEPDDRPDAAEVAAVLAAAAGIAIALPGVEGLSQAPGTVLRSAATPGVDAPADAAAASRPPAVPGIAGRHRRARRLGRVVGVGVLTGLLVVGGAVLLAPGERPLDASTPTPDYDCVVSYQASLQPAGTFTAALAVQNTGKQALTAGWALGFSFPGNQRLRAGGGGAWRQAGTAVTFTSPTVLPAGHARTVSFTASSAAVAVPAAFTVNGRSCAMLAQDATRPGGGSKAPGGGLPAPGGGLPAAGGGDVVVGPAGPAGPEAAPGQPVPAGAGGPGAGAPAPTGGAQAPQPNPPAPAGPASASPTSASPTSASPSPSPLCTKNGKIKKCKKNKNGGGDDEED